MAEQHPDRLSLHSQTCMTKLHQQLRCTAGAQEYRTAACNPGSVLTFAPPTLQVYPDRVAGLPPQQFGRLLQTLEVGVASNDREALLSSLEAVASLGQHDYELRTGGHPGVQAAGAWQPLLWSGGVAWGGVCCNFPKDAG